MINLILEVSKYMMIFLMAVYTWANFRYFSFSDEERKQSICGRQNRVMFLLHFLSDFMSEIRQPGDHSGPGRLLCGAGAVFPDLHFPDQTVLPECVKAADK